MKYPRLLIMIFALSLAACSGGGDGGGGGGGGNPTDPSNPGNETPSEGAIRSCTIANGSGVEQFSGGVWGTCTVLSCDSGYERVGNTCQQQTQVVAPSNLAYPQNVQVFRGQNIVPVLPSYDGTITSFVISPALPSGLTFNTSTGGISGTALIESNERTYTVVGTGQGGSTSTTVKVEVREPFPTFVNYLSSNPTYVVGQGIQQNEPSSDFEASITGYSISPALPSGLQLNTSTGVITGVPTGALAETAYTVTASYNGGSVQTTINIQIVAPPTSFEYPQSSYNFSTGETFSDIVPNYVGPAFPAVKFEIDESSDALPDGINLNSSSGAFTTFGINLPNTDTGPRNIVVKVFIQDSPTVFLTTSVILTVSSQPTTNLTYNVPSMLYRKLEAFPSNYPVFDGQAPDGNGDPTNAFKICLASNPSSCEGNSCGAMPNSCAINESKILPQGITFSSVSGRITGSSDFTVAATDYIVTATYSASGGGTISTNVTIQIVEALPSFTYSINSINVRKNEPLADSYDSSLLTPNNSSQTVAITGWVIDRPLPAGMSFDGAISQGLPQDASAGGTGEVSGTPTEISEFSEYTISACNSDGCSSQPFYVRVYSALDKLVAGKNHSCVVFSDENDSLYCWGDNTHGQLGFETTETCSGGDFCSKKGGFVELSNGSRLQNVRAVALGDNHSCALIGLDSDVEHDLYCWGDNSFGQLGINSGVITSTDDPQQVRRGFNSGENLVIDGIQVVAGGNDACYLSPNVVSPRGDGFDALLGNIFCWGENYTARAELLPGQNSLGFSSISYGVDHGCATIYNNTDVDPSFDGRVFCWGSNEFSKLGSLGADSTSPQQVASALSFDDMEKVHLGQDHSCSLDSNNQLYCWGSNYFGQFGVSAGVGSFTNNFENPVNTGIATSDIFGNGLMNIISNSNTFTLEYFGKTPIVGSVFTQASQSTPKTIEYFLDTTLLDFIGNQASIGASSDDFSCAISSNEEVYCWGDNTSGKLGTGDEISQELPTRTDFDF